MPRFGGAFLLSDLVDDGYSTSARTSVCQDQQRRLGPEGLQVMGDSVGIARQLTDLADIRQHRPHNFLLWRFRQCKSVG